MENNSRDIRIIKTVISEEFAGFRIDNWLAYRFTYLSRNGWQKIIKQQQIFVNNKTIRPSKKLQEGDIVTYHPAHEEPPVDKSFSIIYEDDDIFLVNKSGNLPCHPAGPFYKHTLWYLLYDHYENFHIIHRLDRETSGIILFAKHKKAAATLSQALANNEFKKTYHTLVYGVFPNSIHARGFLHKDITSEVNKKRAFSENEQTDSEYAETFFRCISSNDNYSLVEAQPKTGRLHQIRATLCSLGYPLLGDKLYGPDDTIFIRFVTKSLREDDYTKLIFKRQALHALRLEFPHPTTKERVSFEAAYPDDITLKLK
jgi:23S rRNA pseudouridine955/2504/2580 synthase/23S rRNA pseudouridine1911/1915/1917 synthase